MSPELDAIMFLAGAITGLWLWVIVDVRRHR
jgi:hypothetical protein